MGEVRYFAYTACPLGAIIAPFLTGLIADRFFNTERVLGVLFLLAGFFMLFLPVIGAMEGVAVAWQEAGGEKIVTAEQIVLFGKTFVKGELFNWIILAHALCFMPTLGLTASLSFHHLKEGDQQFPLIRLWGTIGWIVAGFVLAFGFDSVVHNGVTTQIEAGTRAIQFYLGGAASVFLGLYCFSLPKTPAPKKGKKVNIADLLFTDIWAQFKKVSFFVFIFCSLLISIPLAAYYASLQQQMTAMGMIHITAWKNIGTFFEAGLMFAMPFLFRRLGIKKMVAIGILAWVVRYVLFALGASPEGVALVVGGIALHGLCYDFFFVTGQVYVDKVTPADIRGQAQSMNIFATQGVGLLIGANVTAILAKRVFGDVASVSPESLHLWPDLWYPMAAMAAVVLVIFLIAFKQKVE